MSEARKCDRCHGFYEIPEEQQDKLKPYDLKGAYAKLLFCDNNRDYPETVRWYDLCPKCVELLNKWLENPDNYDPYNLIKNVDEEYQKALEGIKTYADDNVNCADRSNGATEKELELASKLNDAKIYIAQLKNELGYTMTNEEIEFMKGIHNFTDEDISEAAKFVETKSSSEDKYKDPCKSCHNAHCEQCDYGYISEEEKKKRWAERHKDETKLSDPYEDGGL